ncbi:hypothetical protein CCH79_00017332 [Gambusia affinis]|uniref:Uncharacterized protein n=1 Tax=Gambusia affinis TaxID=33528 RepID=A0A315WIR4_GAMAF|nr:hypothetical protein CCH79_00017332 [Gambusia affinis]
MKLREEGNKQTGLFEEAKILQETGQIDPILIEHYNSPGFVGCLSRVQLNNVAPLKAALRSGTTAPVSIHGILVQSNCGASPLTIPPIPLANDLWKIEAGGAVFPFKDEKIGGDPAHQNFAVIAVGLGARQVAVVNKPSGTKGGYAVYATHRNAALERKNNVESSFLPPHDATGHHLEALVFEQ